MLQRGDIAPDFDAVDCRGERVTIGEYRGKRKVVLFFFPRAFTPACTLEVRNFRDNHDRISTAGAELIGVSVDRAERNCKFAEAEGLQFRLVGDESKMISELYGVVWPVLRIDRRATFVIDEQGVIIEVIHHEVQVYRHLEDVLERLGASKT
ncbi:MAG: peroxiredoxin [Archangium sp.]|nr:peroxiredoxin [Archangium sp.]MDP3154599.1 peroxiredoxin [Archangium sp.]MDP3574349.1 peroxiredoxin [Archangium sp.]